MTQHPGWRATVSYTTTIDAITDDQADALVAALPGFGVIHHNAETGRVDLSMTVPASTLRKAIDEALRSAQAAYADAFDVTGTAAAVHVLAEDDYQRELAHPGALDLVGVSEIAEMAGVNSRQRAHQLTATPGFPTPVGVVAAGKIYTRQSVAKWLEGWSRTPGWAGKHAREQAA